MSVLPSWIFAAMDKAMGPMTMAANEGMKAAAAPVPTIYKIMVPALLLGIMAVVVGITVMTIFTLLRKRVPLVDQFDDPSTMEVKEMSPFEAASQRRPIPGKILAVFFILGVFAFTFMGLLTMGRGSSTTEQLRKEGREKAQKNKERLQGGGSTEIGEDSDAMEMSEFGADGMFKNGDDDE